MREIAQAFAAAAVDGFLHAVDIDAGTEVRHHADESVVLASVFKIPVLLEFYRQAAVGELDATEAITVPVEDRTMGPFGLSIMRDPVTMSLRDLAWLMMGISDNAATDVLCDRVGISNVNALLKELGLAETVIEGACRDVFQSMADDLGLGDTSGYEGIDLTDPSVVDRLRAIDPLAASRSTPRDITKLLAMIWRDEAAPPEACEEARRTMGQQVWQHRLASGFPQDDVRVSGKTGTLPRWRNESGVVEYPDGGRYAVAVFTRSHSPSHKDPTADAVIGTTARLAVGHLRSAND